MNILFATLFILLILYAGILLWMAAGYYKTTFFQAPERKIEVAVTIIVVARNEEKHIGFCLKSILAQDYPRDKIELIVINDASSDATRQISEEALAGSGVNYRIVSNQMHRGKKKSLTNGIHIAENELIVTRDADTFTVSNQWLANISAFYQEGNPDLIIGPIALTSRIGILPALQAFENNILFVLACGSAWYNKAFLCSGANLAFTKTIFKKADGYSSHIDISSGDDVLFLEDVKKVPDARVGFLKSANALVFTHPCMSVNELLQQKVRWASKFKVNRNSLNRVLAVLVLLVNLGWLLCLLLFPVKPFFAAAVTFIFIKLIIDLILLFLASDFNRNRKLLVISLPVAGIYPLYVCAVALASVLLKPNWKQEGAL